MATLKELINTMFSKNEAKPSESYVISHAQKAESGWSFGQAQWDLSKNPTVHEYLNTNTEKIERYTARKMFSDILSSATSGGNRILSDKEVGSIMDEVKKSNGNISAYKDRIDLALQSDYGRQEINTSYDLYLDYKIKRLNTLYSELEGAGSTDVANYIRGNTLMQMMLIDYDNQFYISGLDGTQKDGQKAKLLQYLKTGEASIYGGDVKVAGAFDIADYLKFIFETEYAYTGGSKDLLRRFFNTMEVAKTGVGLGGLLTEDEWKIVNGIPNIIKSPVPSPKGNDGSSPIYTVKSGDTLSKIANRLGLTTQELMELNPNINDANKISVGQKLVLPDPSAAGGNIDTYTKTLQQHGLISDGMFKQATTDISNFFKDGWNIVKSGWQKVIDTFFPPTNPSSPSSSLSPDPIGAYYETRNPANDNALSIADKTPVILDSNKEGLTEDKLKALDINKDGKLSQTRINRTVPFLLLPKGDRRNREMMINRTVPFLLSKKL